MKSDNIDILNRILSAIKNRGLSIYEFCKKYNHSEQMVSNWKRRGLSNPGLAFTKFLLDLSRVTGLSVNHFIENKEPDVNSELQKLIDENKQLRSDNIAKDNEINKLKTSIQNVLREKYNK